ncbi:LemA family protein [Egibacter rhizosphaerae]|uniref:LemA family protein n=1 Tax=Egibacter rhizosphaerae TaxID=1670831 RepID=A0A411YAP8_9ACTN|nr:LemA family protein [Egibacter rhizosphaerae]QBI18303.1 LemA family protein [Egibacter rhizosphaerae]
MLELVLVLLAAGVLLAAILGVNRLVKLRNRVSSAWADLEVQLTRRRELIPNLVATVEGYARHERDTLEALATARAAGDRSREDPRRSADAEEQVDRRLASVVALAEAYPDLKADERFRELHNELVGTENKIAFSRQLYNDTVTAYRTATRSFPGVLFARRLGFEPPALFDADVGERGAATVQLDRE